MSGISSLINSGMSALNAAQVEIQVTGQNIANVDTTGYSDQTAVLEPGPYYDSGVGQLGTGVDVAEIQRSFNSFVEQSYNTMASTASRYNYLNQNMDTVQSNFNESSTDGLSASLTTFLNDWQGLSLDPSGTAERQSVLSDSQSLISTIQQTSSTLSTIQSQANDSITSDVSTLNGLLTNIASLNQQLDISDQPGVNNANGLLDTRTQDIRKLAQIIDVNVMDNGSGDLTITDKAGHTLVDGTNAYSVKLETNQVIDNLTAGSGFDGTVGFSGSDNFEYTVKVVQGGNVSSGASAAKFEVSLDGGVTWLRSNSGAIETFSARPQSLAVAAGNLNIYFGQNSNTSLTPNGQLTTGDTFTIVPKTGLFWYGSASTPINITPQVAFNGQDNTTRVTGGSLAGEFELRDYDIGRYQEQLNAMTQSLIYETNRIHSQGAGTEMFNSVTGTYQASSPDVALGSDSSGLTFSSRLTSGASMMYVYNSSGQLVSNSYLNFNTSGTGMELFNPNMDTLSDVAGAINNTFGNFLTASVVNNQLQIDSKSGYTFGFGTDSTGLWATLGINTFFAGKDANTISINPLCAANTSYINAGQIDGTGYAESGNNQTALNISGLSSKAVSIQTTLSSPTSQTIQGYYSNIVGLVGSDAEGATFKYNYNNTLATDLNNQQQSASGVNLDQEMSNLVRFQHSYQAAAKMISTADQMWQTVLALKQ
jgi:flagellar hook-associated protein 1 FlgK